MNNLLQFLIRDGYWLTFGLVFAEQMGLPLPAGTILIGMGALSRSGNFFLMAVILTALCAGLVADMIWYHLGWRHGHSVLRSMCRISLEPDFCIRRTENVFQRLGLWTLLVAKFVPGLNAAAVPLAGMLKTRFVRFLAFDLTALVLWSGTYSSLGYIFSNQIQLVIRYLSQLGISLLILAGGSFAMYVAYKYRQRQRFLKTLAAERITPEELRARLDARETILVLDLRNQLDVNTDRFRIPGAFHTLPELLEQEADIPSDNEVVLYCT